MTSDFAETSSEGPGKVIGRYKLLQDLGEGGFGTVWMAEQTEPVVRRVALKVIKLGMDTKQVIARFEAERQVLAMMDHPNISRVLDAGATSSGRPYFVMELVRGVSITKFCDEVKLPLRDRMKLFIDVCHAVQHAHQKGIIHRDIKPSNVLVSMQEGKPVAKVIDFGIAKATDRRLTEHTLFTEFSQVVGTPEYMSPEQAELSALEVDTRADIYSLGVLLYELMTGTKPFELRMALERGWEEMLRYIREVEPPKPSTRMGSLGAKIQEIAKLRQTDSKHLGKWFQGDLDWIVMKALEKDRARRYQTANAFAEDIDRHLHHEPVEASPPSAAYRLRKLVRRNRATFAVGALVALLLIGGVTGTGIGFVRASDAADRASVEAIEATRQAEIAEAINEFLNEDLLAAVAPSVEEGRGRDVAMRDVLDRAAIRIEEEAQPGGRFADKPRVEAAIRRTIGQTYLYLGELTAAAPHLERALDLRRRVLGDEDPDTLISLYDMGVLLKQLGQLDEALRCHLEVLAAKRRTLDDDDPSTLRSLASIGSVLRVMKRYDEAERYLREALAGQRRVLGEDNLETLNSMNGLALVLDSQGRFEEAEPLYRAALAGKLDRLGEDDRSTLESINNLAMWLQARGRYGDAEPYQRQALSGMFHVLGPTHPNTLTSMHNLGVLLKLMERHDESEPIFRELVRARREADPFDPIALASPLANLGTALLIQGRYREAEPLLRECLEIREDHLSAVHWHLHNARNLLGGSLAGQGKFREAEPLLVDGYEQMQPPPRNAVYKREALERIVEAYRAWDEAEPGAGHDAKAAVWKSKM